VTLYLLDENVLRALQTPGNRNVQRWYASVAPSDLRISAVTLFEKRRGWERLSKSDPERAAAGLANIAAFEALYGDRIVAIDKVVAAEWARLLGAKDKHQFDMALAATARVHGLVLVTRNVDDFRGREVDVLDPFRDPPFTGRV
jgi:predicted nucleic acid-binding protein